MCVSSQNASWVFYAEIKGGGYYCWDFCLLAHLITFLKAATPQELRKLFFLLEQQEKNPVPVWAFLQLVLNKSSGTNFSFSMGSSTTAVIGQKFEDGAVTIPTICPSLKQSCCSVHVALEEGLGLS